MGNFFIFNILIIPEMPGTRGHPTKTYPQISLTKDLYDKLRDLKFELKVDSLGDVVSILIEEHEARKDVK